MINKQITDDGDRAVVGADQKVRWASNYRVPS
jgi:hypothetical protein